MTTLPSYDIVLAGRGGQGVIFLSRIMGQAALLQGLGVRTTETHGMAMRGGSVKCFVRIGDVYGPLFGSGSADLLMALHPSEAPSGLPLLKGEGTVMTNTDVVQSLPGLGEDQKVWIIDADRITRECGNNRSANLALLGGTVAMVDRFPLEVGSIEGAIVNSGPPKAVEENIEIFRKGQLSAGS